MSSRIDFCEAGPSGRGEAAQPAFRSTRFFTAGPRRIVSNYAMYKSGLASSLEMDRQQTRLVPPNPDLIISKDSAMKAARQQDPYNESDSGENLNATVACLRDKSDLLSKTVQSCQLS